MADLTTTYMGLTLKNPVIAASSGLTATIEDIKALEKNGIGAVVIKSLFEEEILLEVRESKREAERNKFLYTELSETFDYIDLHVKEDRLNNYIKLLTEVKDKILIPVIASINCISPYEWIEFAEKIEKAGADALELNIFINPANQSDKSIEQTHLSILTAIKQRVSIPVAVKISPYITKLAAHIKQLSESGANAIVMFNRFYTPDIDIDKIKIKPATLLSSPVEQGNVLRWIGLIADKVDCDLAASTGIHSAEDIIKQLLAGATAVQIASILYQKGVEYIPAMLDELEAWMGKKGFQYLSQFRGKLSWKTTVNAAAYERMQFMKYFSGIE